MMCMFCENPGYDQWPCTGCGNPGPQPETRTASTVPLYELFQDVPVLRDMHIFVAGFPNDPYGYLRGAT